MSDHNWHHRHALQVACPLPDDSEDALVILRMATQLVTDFLHADQPAKKPTPVVALIGGHECA
jgi:hypothetical protein